MAVVGFIVLILLCAAVMGAGILVGLTLLRLTAPRGYATRGRRKRRPRAEHIERAIARYDEVQRKRARNVFFWPW